MSDEIKKKIVIDGIDEANKQIKDTTKSTNIFRKGLDGLQGGFKSAIKGISSLGTGFKAVDVAIKATGIGALVLLIVQLGQKVIEAASKFAVFEKALNFIGDILSGVSAVVERFVELVVDGVIGAFNSIEAADIPGLLFDALLFPFKLIADGYTEAINVIIKGLNLLGADIEELEQPFGVLEKTVNSVTGAVTELGTAFETQRAAEAFRREADLIIKENERTIESLQGTIEVNKQVASDSTLSAQERTEALQAVQTAQAEQSRLAIQNAELELEAIRRLNEATGNRQKDTEAELAAEAALNKAKSEAAKLEAENIKEANALAKELFEQNIARLTTEAELRNALVEEQIRQTQRIADNEQKTDAERIAALGIVEEKRREQLERTRQLQIKAAADNAEQIRLINSKFSNDILDLEQQTASTIEAIRSATAERLQKIEEDKLAEEKRIAEARVDIIREVNETIAANTLEALNRQIQDETRAIDERIDAIVDKEQELINSLNAAQEQEVDGLRKALAEGLISREEFEQAQLATVQKFSLERQKIQEETETNINKILADADAERNRKAEETLKALQDKAVFVLNAINDVAGGVFDIFSVSIDNKLAELDERGAILGEELSTLDQQIAQRQQAVNELNKTAENAIGNQRKTALAALSAEQQQLAELQRQREEAAEQEKEIEEEKARLAKRQFRLTQIQSLAQVAIQTALGIIGAFAPPEGGPLRGPILAGIIGTIGALQAATIAAQKPPSFATGGFTGEGGKFEPAGIVHKGEWVAPQEMVKDPITGPIISKLENSRMQGFAEGGMVGENITEIPSQPEIVVSVQDIDLSQERVNRAKARSTL